MKTKSDIAIDDVWYTQRWSALLMLVSAIGLAFGAYSTCLSWAGVL